MAGEEGAQTRTPDDGTFQRGGPRETAAPSGTQAPSNEKSSFLDTLRKVRNEDTGIIPFGVVVLACAILVIPLYNLLGLPALYLSNVFLTLDCASNSWICGAWLALLASSGPILIGVLLLVFRTQVGRLLVRAKVPAEADFFVVPVLATLFFTIGWAGIAFHFFDREGLVLDGYFPVVFGALVFALGRWGGWVKVHAVGLFAPREVVPSKFRILALFGAILLLGWILGPVHAPQRDQIVTILAVLLGWWLFTSLPQKDLVVEPRPARATLWAWLPLAILGTLAAVAERVLAQPCIHQTSMDFFDCEQAHHNGTAAAASGAVGTLAAGAAIAPRDPLAARQPQSIEEQLAADAKKREMERWKILQETQTKIHEIQQDVTVNKAKTADKAWDNWQDFIRN